MVYHYLQSIKTYVLKQGILLSEALLETIFYPHLGSLEGLSLQEKQERNVKAVSFYSPLLPTGQYTQDEKNTPALVHPWLIEDNKCRARGVERWNESSKTKLRPSRASHTELRSAARLLQTAATAGTQIALLQKQGPFPLE